MKIKKIMYIVKKIVMALCLIYTINVALGSFGIFIPINVFSITSTSILGFPVLVALIIVKKII